MKPLAKRLPPPTSLLAFEAAARHGSFTSAARELNVTQAAISQHVRKLEEHLGILLFHRLHRGLQITPEGDELFRTATMAFEHISATADRLKPQSQSNEIYIGVTMAIATFWLLPRLPKWRALHPDIEVHLVATDRGFEAIEEKVDAAIVFDTPKWPGFEVTRLSRTETFPVCSPDYLIGKPPINNVEDLLEHTLLAMDDDRPTRIDWPVWFAQMGLGGQRSRHSIRINSIPLLLQAALNGHGIALGWSLLTDDFLEDGTLVRPVDASMTTEQYYYFLLNESNKNSAFILFRDWICDQFDSSAFA